MTLNLIDKKMVVRNTIEIQPDCTYISASLSCNDYESYGISGAEIVGQLDASLTKIKHYNEAVMNNGSHNVSFSKTFLINKDYNNENNLTALQKLNNIKFKNEAEDYTQENADHVLKSEGFSQDTSASFKFGIEKVKQKYLIDDKNFYKKQSVKNLYKYYRENIHHRVIDPNWGFFNYNAINFFNISSPKNVGKTHKNCIAFANPIVDNKPLYNFFNNNNDKLTISFYLNQNNKNIENYSFNPGCIFFVEGVIGIYLVKGSSTDKNGLTDKFRILTVLGDSLNNEANIKNFLNSKIDDNGEVKEDLPGTSFYLSNDNIINYNNWQNITITLQATDNSTSDLKIIDTSIYIDGKQNSSTELALSPSPQGAFNELMVTGNRNFILIGNRYSSQNIADNLYKKLFSINKSALNDLEGAYVNKNIDFGKTAKELYFETEFTNDNFSLNDQLVASSNNDYFTDDTSFALTAEIHDLRVYNQTIDANNIDYKICKNSIRSFLDEDLVFSLPVYYYNSKIKKKSLVNLNNIANNNSTTGSLSDINIHNLATESPVNYYFSNKSMGHDVSIENFLYEFKVKSCPNIILNDDIFSEQKTANCFNILAYNENIATDTLSESNSFISQQTKEGKTLNSSYSKRLAALKSEQSNVPFDYFYNNYIAYKNNLILPCDNGLQIQHRHQIPGYYESNEKPSVHNDEHGIFNLDFISLNNLIKEEMVHESNNLLFEIANSELFDYTQELREISSLERRQNYHITEDITFKESYDNFKNASLNNYFRDNFTLSGNDDLYLKKKDRSNAISERRFIQIGNGSFLKDLSNPVSRKINDNFDNSIADFLPLVDSKTLDLNNQNRINYYKFEFPLLNINNTSSESFSNILCVSTQLFGRKIERETVEIFDSDIGGTLGSKKIKLKDNGKGTMYRADCLTQHADWNCVGHCLYHEGIITILHPSLENFTENGYKLQFKSSKKLNVLELNLPAYSGRTNKSYNESQIKNLRLDESAFNSDEDFVYISDINLHDENLNIVAKAKIVKPFPKKDTDNVLFRLKMDF